VFFTNKPTRLDNGLGDQQSQNFYPNFFAAFAYITILKKSVVCYMNQESQAK
jgi:hypothetical protein